MMNRQILKKVIEKVARNGYKSSFLDKVDRIEFDEDDSGNDVINIIDDRSETSFRTTTVYIEYPEHFIFSHDFAKAFFGEKDVCSSCGEEFIVKKDDAGFDTHYCSCGDSFDPNKIPVWRYHLQQMVALPDGERIKYLEKFI